jgi:predicted chitinase
MKLRHYDQSNEAMVINAITDECLAQGLEYDVQYAYVIATVAHETAGTFKPVKEAFWQSEDWRKKHLRYYPYYGRGYVQLTWKDNYKKYGDILGLDLVNNPDLVMEPDTALFILVHGFKHGIFTGKKLENYVNEDKTDWINARRCINGLDCAQKIANLAEKYVEM